MTLFGSAPSNTPPAAGAFGSARTANPPSAGQFGAVDTAAWSPLDLFGGGEEGFYFAESDASARFQDAARTTAASPGEPLGGLTDLSGNGHHAGQSTAASRPTLAGSGLAVYGTYDGSDDYMDLTIGSGVLGATTGATFWCLAQLTGGASSGGIFYMSHNGNASNSKTQIWKFGSQTTLTFTYDPDDAGSQQAAGGTNTNINAVICTINTTTNVGTVYIDGSSVGTDTDAVGDYAAGAEAVVRIGGFSNAGLGLFSPWVGEISHAGCINRVLTADERTSLNDWLVARKWT